MVGHTTLVFSALVAFAQSKAIVTNHCKYDVHIWSVPEQEGIASNLVLKSGGSYEEPFRFGTKVNPGIAIKVSSHPNGIYDGKDEIDFAYSLDKSDDHKVWVSLELVRGKAFENDVALFTCYGPYKSPFVPTRQCNINDDIELTLCGTERRSHPVCGKIRPPVAGNCSHPPVKLSKPTHNTGFSNGTVPTWPLKQVQEALQAISGLSNYTEAIRALDAKFPQKLHRNVLGKKPTVHVGDYVRKFLPETSGDDLEDNLNHHFSRFEWTDDEGHGTDYGWPSRQAALESRANRKPSYAHEGKTALSYAETCNMLGRMSGTTFNSNYATSGGYDCDAIVKDLRSRILIQAANSRPRVRYRYYLDWCMSHHAVLANDSEWREDLGRILQRGLVAHFDTVKWLFERDQETDFGWPRPWFDCSRS
ncbi:hypothetical protein B0J11DRAFT_164326 [Dendryphion nanum]|uniref:Uncharacterized protein n=1 Tax=Dendryphion nanum TaxID=256645 RepID=A0A9P9EDF3_9PLEO|nr:hypothetical protein B0J11DRAFT_164326 [Dendryphion nanum]